MITDELLFRYLNGESTRKESRFVDEWLSADPENGTRLDDLRQFLQPAQMDDADSIITEEWMKLSSGMHPDQRPFTGRPVITLQRIRIAAVLALVLASGILLLTQKDRNVIRNRENITKCVLLPDGTQVDLGPLSKLTYEKQFLKGNRTVQLTGEAFFDVTSDPDHPFTVIAGSAKIRVTGTKFFVNATPRTDEVEVTVRSGKVLFYNSEILDKNSFRMGLAAGERGIFYPALNRMDKTSDPYFNSTP